MHVITSIDGMKALSRQIHGAGKTLALVPTMGALHEGHLSLIRCAKRQCDAIVVSIFVNPTQFAPSEDLDHYPQDLEKDINLLRPFNVDAVFAPRADEVYPPGFETFVECGAVARVLEGASRPGHFRGVATVVLKLFHIVSPDLAYFGQKDFQQTAVIRRMVGDFNLNVRLIICPIVRDSDGVAISSRNAYLSAAQRESARQLNRSLQRARELVWSGETRAVRVAEEMRRVLAEEGNVLVDYVAIVDPGSLNPVERVVTGCVALVAARVGPARLIDNSILGSREATEEQLLQSAPGREDGLLRAPGLEAESLKLHIQNCRACAAISSVILPPREFLMKYLKNNYPDLNAIEVLVIGRDAPWNSAHYLYYNSQAQNRFLTRLYELVGVKDFAEFKARAALTDALRCHAIVTPVPERALSNCAPHLREELKLFPNLRVIVVLGEDAYLQFQRSILGRDREKIAPLNPLLRDHGWAEEKVSLVEVPGRMLQVIYCYHPVGGYQGSPSISQVLA